MSCVPSGAIVISAGLVSALAPLISKLLLGEWPHWFHRLQAVSVARKQSMYERKSAEWQSLARIVATSQWESLSEEEIRAYQAAQHSLRC